MIETSASSQYAVELCENSGWNQTIGSTAVQLRGITVHVNPADPTITRPTEAAPGPEFTAGKRFQTSTLNTDMLEIDQANGPAGLRVHS